MSLNLMYHVINLMSAKKKVHKLLEENSRGMH